MERFDLFTVLILSSVLAFVFFIFLWNFKKVTKKYFFGFKYIMYGYFGYSIGVLLLALREFIPYSTYFSILLGNFALVAGLMVLNLGILRLFDIKERFKINTLFFLFFCIVFYYFAVIDDNISIRIIFVSLILALFYLNSAIVLCLKSIKDNTIYYRSISILLLAYVLVNLGRAVLASINYSSISNFLAYSEDILFHILVY